MMSGALPGPCSQRAYAPLATTSAEDPSRWGQFCRERARTDGVVVASIAQMYAPVTCGDEGQDERRQQGRRKSTHDPPRTADGVRGMIGFCNAEDGTEGARPMKKGGRSARGRCLQRGRRGQKEHGPPPRRAESRAQEVLPYANATEEKRKAFLRQLPSKVSLFTAAASLFQHQSMQTYNRRQRQRVHYYDS